MKKVNWKLAFGLTEKNKPYHKYLFVEYKVQWFIFSTY